MQPVHVILLSSLAGHVAAQALKILYRALRARRLSMKSIVQDGGMPSVHTATAMAMAWSVYLVDGLSTAFAVAVIVTMFVVIDALHIRAEVGRHAAALNALLKRKTFKEDAGHTLPEVLAGAITGIAAASAIVQAL